MDNIFLEITIILCLAAVLSIIFKTLRQPLILAYLLAGIIIGPFGQLQFASSNVLQVMGELGITLALFMLGLEIRLKEFQSIGRAVLIGGIAQIVVTQIIIYLISLSIGFSSIISFYISIALAFSSTIIVVKLLSDKRDIKSLYGRITVGFLLVQDFAAIFILIFLSGFNPSTNEATFSVFNFILILIKAAVLFLIIIYLSKNIFPKVVDLIAKSSEALFLVSIAWVFGLAVLVSSPLIGFSIEIGGFLAGLSLANAIENYQIVSRVKPLRDFFITIFFIYLGMKINFQTSGEIFLPAVIFILLVLILKPIIVMGIMGLMKYRKRTSFLTGTSLGQVSEFSLIIIFLGNKLGHISDKIVSLVVLILIATFLLSTYTIINSENLYKLLRRYLSLFERKGLLQEETISKVFETEDLKDHVVLIGANRMGQSILDAIKDLGQKLVVVDFDPDIIKKLKDQDINSFFGDIADLDIQEKANLSDAKLVISTVPDIEDNLLLIKGLNHSNRKAKIIVSASDPIDAKELYKAGADYVVLPHLAGGRHIAKILAENNLEKISHFKTKDLSYL